MDVASAYRGYITYSVLEKCVNSEGYLNFDRHFCSGDRKCIYKGADNIIDMTIYRKRHQKECSLPILETYNKARYIGTINEESDSLACTKEDLKWTIDAIRELPDNFGDALMYLMKKRKVSTRILADRTLLSEKDIQRMRRGETRPKLNKLIALCIGLNLCPRVSMELLRKAGYSLRMNEEEQAYLMLLTNCFNMNIYECNTILEELGFEPLTKL